MSGIQPPHAYIGRSQELLISGSSTAWTDATAVSFGEGVTVDEVVAASPAALRVKITVADGAALGPRDVTVGGATLRTTFAVESPLRARASPRLL